MAAGAALAMDRRDSGVGREKGVLEGGKGTPLAPVEFATLVGGVEGDNKDGWVYVGGC